MEEIVVANAAHRSRADTRAIDLSSAAWFLVIVGLWEIIFNRLAYSLGLYTNVGASGALSWLATSGRFAMSAVATMTLVLACASLPRIASSTGFGPLPLRILIIFISPLYLPIICVAIFRPVSVGLIFYAYLAAAGSAAFLSVIVALRNIDSSRKRLILALGIVQLLAAFERLAANSDISEAILQNAYLLAEVLFLVTPIFGFFILKSGYVWAFIKRPHLLGLVFACLVTGLAILLVAVMPSTGQLIGIAYRTLGITMAIPHGTPLYLAAFFLGALIIGSSILPSRRWPPSPHTRRIGFGLFCIWSAGIQPSRPYLFALMLMGFIYLARGLVGEIEETQ
ncbi:MAG: hypothetical protein QNJ97_02380 [Myxococcota bacterium]|nr:hypothetical protein [Myxococcota bacterium]